MTEPKAEPTFTIHKQKIERVILQGQVSTLDAALAWLMKRKYVASRVGPKLLGKAGIDERRFVLLGEKVIR